MASALSVVADLAHLPNIVFRFFFAILYAAVIVVCLEAVRIASCAA